MEKKPKTKKDHWEVDYDPTVHKNSKDTMGSQFSPKKSTERMTTYKKVNEQDH